jgi:hypothetical protein
MINSSWLTGLNITWLQSKDLSRYYCHTIGGHLSAPVAKDNSGAVKD